MGDSYAMHDEEDVSHAAAMALPSWQTQHQDAPPLSPGNWHNYFSFPDEAHGATWSPPPMGIPAPACSSFQQPNVPAMVPHPSASGWSNFGTGVEASPPQLGKTLKRKAAVIGTLSSAFEGLVAYAPPSAGLRNAIPPPVDPVSIAAISEPARPPHASVSPTMLQQHRMAMHEARAQPFAQGVPGFTLSPLTAKPVTFFSYSTSDPHNEAPPARLSLNQSWSGRASVSSASEPYPSQSHAPIHGDRPFKCDICPQTFNRGHDLKRHKRIHLVIKPYPCGWCERTFSRKDALKRHLLVKGCGAGLGQTQEDSEMGISRAPSLQRVPMEAHAELAASTSRSPSTTDEVGSPDSTFSQPVSPSSPPMVSRKWPPHSRRRSAPTFLAMPPPPSPSTIFAAKREHVSPTQLLADPPVTQAPQEPRPARPRMLSMDSYADSGSTGSSFASPEWLQRADSGDSGMSSNPMDDDKPHESFDPFVPSLTIVSASYAPPNWPPPFTTSPPSAGPESPSQ